MILLTYFIEMLISFVFFSQIGDRRHRNMVCWIIGLLIFESGAVINLMLSNIVWLNTLYFGVINFLFGILCFKIKLSRTFFYSAVLVIFNATLEFATIFLVSAITDSEVTSYLDRTGPLIIEAVISKTLYFLVCMILARLITKESRSVKFPIGLYLYPIVTVAAVLVFWSICTSSYIGEKHQIALAAVSAALFFATVILFVSYQSSVEKDNELFMLQNELEKTRTEKNYYDILEKQNEELLIYTHDTKNHLAAISALNDNEQIDEYISTMTNQLKKYSRTCHSGNHMLDVIINKYVTECEIKNIDFSFDVRLANFRYIDNYDLVAVLGNILDNSLEAAEKSKDKRITFSTSQRNNYDVIVVENSCDDKPVNDNRILKTTKQDKKLHGLGIKSVIKTLKKYAGDMEWDYDDNRKVFTCTVMLLKPDENKAMN